MEGNDYHNMQRDHPIRYWFGQIFLDYPGIDKKSGALYF